MLQERLGETGRKLKEAEHSQERLESSEIELEKCIQARKSIQSHFQKISLKYKQLSTSKIVEGTRARSTP